MSWLSKSLTLDLLAIAIDGLNKTYARINVEEAVESPWVPGADEEAQAAAPAPVEVPPATPPAPAESPAPVEQITVEEAPAPAPELDGAALLAEAQTLLRTIAQTTGTDWITGTLFPHFFTDSLNTIPVEKLPELIAMATAHKELN